MKFNKCAANLAIIIITLLTANQSCCVGEGAGVLPYKIENGFTYFLVGNNPHKRGVCDFGGQYDAGKDGALTDPTWSFKTATREFNEETMFMFSAGTLPIPALIETLQHGHLSIPNHRTLMPAIGQATHRLRRAGPGFDYTMHIVPVAYMPFQPQPHELWTQHHNLEGQCPNAWLIGAEPNDFVWLEKRDLYNALTRTAPGTTVIVPAPTSRNPGRIFTLSAQFAGMLWNAVNEQGSVGLQAVMP